MRCHVASALLVFTACGGKLSGSYNDTSDAATTAPDVSGDAGPETTAGEGGTPPSSMCPSPADVSGFVAPPSTPPHVDPTACTSQQISDFYQTCLGSARNDGDCETLMTTDATCFACLVSKSTDPSLGPLIESGAITLTLNIAGCIAIMQNDSSATSCAARLEAAEACENAACAAQCPITDVNRSQLFDECVNLAAMGGCANYASAECSLGDASTSQCTSFANFEDGYFVFAPLFCSN